MVQIVLWEANIPQDPGDIPSYVHHVRFYDIHPNFNLRGLRSRAQDLQLDGILEGRRDYAPRPGTISYREHRAHA